MRVKRGSACIHLLRIRHVERTQFSPHRYSHTLTHTHSKERQIWFLFSFIFFLLPHLSSEFVPTLFAIWLSGSGHNSNAWILCAVVCSCKLHGTHTHTEPSTRLSACAISSLPLCLSSLMLYLLLGNGNSAAQKKAFYYC